MPTVLPFHRAVVADHFERAKQPRRGPDKPQEAVLAYREATTLAADKVGPSTQAWLKVTALINAVSMGGGESSDAADIVSLLDRAGRPQLAAKMAFELGSMLSARGRDATALFDLFWKRIGPGRAPSLMAAQRALAIVASGRRVRESGGRGTPRANGSQ
jgi:hypothetical protein